MLSIDQLIGLGACLAALGAALATFMTVREMAKQRRAAYMPELVISEKIVSLQTSYDLEPKLFRFSRTFNMGSEQLESNIGPTIQIANVGLGSAKRIDAKWIIDANKIAKEISKIASKCSIDASFKYDARHGFLSIEGKEIHSIIHMVENQVRQQWIYLIPVSVDQQGIQLKIPPFFIDSYLFGMTAAFKEGSGDLGLEGRPILSVADLVLEYLDIQNNSYKKKYEFELEMTFGQMKPSTETDKSETYDFTVRLKAAEVE